MRSWVRYTRGNSHHNGGLIYSGGYSRLLGFSVPSAQGKNCTSLHLELYLVLVTVTTKEFLREMSTSNPSTASRDEKPDEKNTSTSAVESYIPHANPHSEGSWFHRAKEEVVFLFTTREGLLGDYELVPS